MARNLTLNLYRNGMIGIVGRRDKMKRWWKESLFCLWWRWGRQVDQESISCFISRPKKTYGNNTRNIAKISLLGKAVRLTANILRRFPHRHQLKSFAPSTRNGKPRSVLNLVSSWFPQSHQSPNKKWQFQANLKQ